MTPRAPDGPGDAAGPDGSADVTAVDLIAALQTNRTTFYTARARGKIPVGDRPTPGGQSRYSPRLAAEIVRAAGRPVPASWGATAGGAK